MEFKVNSRELEKLLSRVFPAVPTRTPMPVLENFLFSISEGLLTVSATDLEIALRSSMNIAADENIEIVVPARLLYDIVRSLSDTQMLFTTELNSKLKISTDKGTYHIGYSPASDFPSIPDVASEREIVINGLELKKAFDQTSFAMSKEDMRPAMTGTLIEFGDDGLRFVATDGHRLVKFVNKSLITEVLAQYIIPERAISVLLKILTETDIKINFSKTNIHFIMDGIDCISRLIGERYPSYSSVIPLENENILKIKSAEIRSSIKRMMFFSSANSKQVKFSINEDILEISAEDIDHGSNAVEKIFCDYKGEVMDIGFNTSYVYDILTHINEEEIIFKLHSPTKACIIEPVNKKEGEELMLLLMPVRLNS